MILPDDPRHGTTRGYHAGCHEACCRAAMARYEKASRLARLRGGRSVSALGAQRRLQALMRLGWSSNAIAVAADLPHRNHVWRIVNGQNGKPTTWLQLSTDRWVRDVYDRLSMEIPSGPYANRTRLFAERNGWPPPLAWVDIDDPNERPVIGRDSARYRAEDLTAEWDHLRQSGTSMEMAARQLGVTVGAIERAIKRAEERAA